MAKLNVTVPQIEAVFPQPTDPNADGELSVPDFKKRLMDLGFNLADFPDEDLIVLDGDASGKISKGEFSDFMKKGLMMMLLYQQ